MADIVIPVVLESLINLLTHEASLLLEVKDQVNLVQGDLRIMNAFLKDSAGKHSEHHLVKELVDQISDVALEAENVVDTYIAKVIKHRRRNRLGKLFGAFGHANMLRDVARKATSIKKTIRNIYENKATYGIREAETECSSSFDLEAKQLLQRRRRRVEEDDVIGFSIDTAKLVSQLTDHDSLERNVISIIGMGGLGKTTLAKKIYNNTHVKNHFDCCALVYVSQEYKVKTLFLDILRCFISISDDIYKMSDEEIEVTLRDYLRGKRYLIVMDDVWKTQVWEDVRSVLPNDLNGSRILITSREKEVASHASSAPPYFLQFLDSHVSWELLCKKVFRGEKCPSNLETIGRKLAESCKGLPLSIVVLGGILAKKEKSPGTWSKFIGNVNWYLTEDKERCLDILALSYNQLPRQLKPCFLYLGVFPEDYEIPTSELTKLWIAEGLIQQTGVRKMDVNAVAEYYLEDLIDRSLIQVVSRKSDGSVKACRIHDLLRDLCVSQSFQDKFFQVHLEGTISSSTKPRRLSVHCDPSHYVDSSNACDTSSVRSLMFFCQGNNFEKKHWQWIWEGFKFIRVLTLLDVDNMNSIPNKIEKLIYLRYLKIGNDKRTVGLRSIDTIPDSICKLRYLETIDLGIQVKDHSWPRSIWRMKQARCMQAYSPMKLPDLQPQSHENDDVLCNLQVISAIYVDRKTAIVISKSKFPNLIELSLSYIGIEEHMNEFEMTEVLVSLENLCYLQKLEINGFPKCEPRLKYLASTLIKVSFYGSYVDSFFMKILGKLPNLRVLKIKRAQNIPKLSFVAGEFPELQVLKMINYGVEMWEVEKNAMPNLQHLVIIRDFAMKALPDELWCLKALQDVKVQAVSRCLWEFLLELKCIMGVRVFEGPRGKVKELTMINGAKLLIQNEHDEWYMK